MGTVASILVDCGPEILEVAAAGAAMVAVVAIGAILNHLSAKPRQHNPTVQAMLARALLEGLASEAPENDEHLRRELQQQAAEEYEDRERTLREEMERQWKEHTDQIAELRSKLLAGIQPEVWPSDEELQHAQDRLVQPLGEHFHCAIAGVAGSGKSSLINAFRGLRNRSPDAARTGVRETTLDITAYRDPSTTLPRKRFVWYDIPGAGTLNTPGWQYFNSQGLFVFDLIIVVTDNRFTEQDITILKHCERCKIPSFLVRSKANQHIGNLMKQEYEWKGAKDKRDFDEVYQLAREMLVNETRESIKENLQEAGLDPGKEIFIVSCDALRSLVREEMEDLEGKDQLIDEEKLVLNCLQALEARRY